MKALFRKIASRWVLVLGLSLSGLLLIGLLMTAGAAGLAWTGEPVYSRYNGPLTPWFLRRNEIWLQLNGAP